MSIECDFCKKEFINTYTLKYHQKTAKYCIKIQKEKQVNVEVNSFTCEYCNKEFNLKLAWSKHIITCKEYKVKLKTEENNKIENYQQKLKEQQTKYEKEIEELNKQIELLKQSKERIIKDQQIKYEKELQKQKEKIFEFLNKAEVLKAENKLLKESLDRYYKLDEKREADYKQENRVLSERQRITNNNMQINNFNGIDFSQARFDRHIENNYTFKLYEKHQEGVKLLFLDFLYFDENIRCVVTDNSRDKIKVMDNDGNHKVMTFTQLHSLCKESKKLVEILEKHAKEYFKKPDTNPLFPLHEEVTERSLNFKEKGLRSIFNKIKGFITSNNENRISSSLEQDDIKSENVNIDEDVGTIPLKDVITLTSSSSSPVVNQYHLWKQEIDLFSKEADEKAREVRSVSPSNSTYSDEHCRQEINIDNLPEVT